MRTADDLAFRMHMRFPADQTLSLPSGSSIRSILSIFAFSCLDIRIERIVLICKSLYLCVIYTILGQNNDKCNGLELRYLIISFDSRYKSLLEDSSIIIELLLYIISTTRAYFQAHFERPS